MTDAFGDFPLACRYSVSQYAHSTFGVWDRDAVDWTRDAAGFVFQYPEAQAHEVAKSLNAPRYVCGCGYTVREDDRAFHESSFCPLTAPEETCPECEGRVYSDGSCKCSDGYPPNAGSAS